MTQEPVRLASLGMGWWSDVLADAVQRSDKIEITSCFTRSADKRKAFAKKYGCNPAENYEEILQDPRVEGIINTTPNYAHLETTRAAAEAGKHIFLDKPIANSISDGREIARVCKDAGVLISVGYQRRRENQFRWIRKGIDEDKFGMLVQAEGNISRDREGKVDLTSWRYQASGMPGGVMLQIGIHYVDILEYLMGRVVAVSARASQLVLKGDNPDVANMLMEHESGAQSILSASYASASEYYLMNIYGKEATAYYDIFEGLRFLTRGSERPEKIPFKRNDTIREELEEFANCIRTGGEPEVDAEKATNSLAVIRAGIRSAEEGRRVTVGEIIQSE